MHNVYGLLEEDTRKKVVVPPDRGQVRRKNFSFHPRLSWWEAVKAGAPQTRNDWNIFDLAPLYPPSFEEPRRLSLILVNFGGLLASEKVALEWSKDFRIKPANPRKIFALGKEFDRLDRLLGFTPMVISSLNRLEYRLFPRTPCLAWNENGERLGLLSDPDEPCGTHFWFAFEEDRS